MEKAGRFAALFLSAALVFSCTACSGGSGQSSQAASSQQAAVSGSSAESGKVYKIGIVQLLEHDALDNAYKGFVDGLKAKGYEDGKNIEIDYENAQNEQANCVTIASKFANGGYDLILAIATPAAQAAANATSTIPILVTAVTDPADAKLVKSNDKPGTNVTGTSDLTPVKEQIDMIKELVPDVKTVGLMYCSSETNSVYQIGLAKKECEALGLKYKEGTVSSSNEIQQVAQSLVSGVQAVYVPTDNMLAAGMQTVTMVTNAAKVPVIVGESGMVKNGGLATYGINYYKLGKQTSEMAVKILTGESKPADMPIEYQKDMDVAVNEKSAAAVGITLPQSLLDKAAKSGNS
jgi:putative ABC transport system substrate-binding protein